MKRIIILVPVFNDWESLKRLLQEINKNIKNFKNIVVDCNLLLMMLQQLNNQRWKNLI